ncbi:MAG TPA: tRNA lysidine(34) synthetase TilS [Candidatus Avacidaminococcus intestinavium]|uniref:tRNA(Ile)-lysidine synthase n=1 Tax=Candidatus Avacidaminococcus intestinavium TaxID=2840684 RepID=A0A9D1SL83_9FIRM|nr:tRNA lysidine(34) synthetase TilS [Candidatus Avacidaminococcus intestinavium]
MSKQKMLTAQLEKLILKQSLLPEGSKIVVACSGGADSMALTMLLTSAQAVKKWQLYVCHIQHHIRETEAERDAVYVEEFCRQRQLIFKRIDCDVPCWAAEKKLSLEEAARELRYQALHEYATLVGAGIIVTAHHKDDQVETVLLNLLRGAGTRGLRGMLAKNGLIVRPLLKVNKRDLEIYCQEQGVKWLVDSTNTDTSYRRNRIRYELLPMLMTYNSKITEKLLSVSELAEQDEAALACYANIYLQKHLKIKQTGSQLNVEKLLQIPKAVSTRVLREAFYKSLTTEKQQLERKHIEALWRLVQNKRSGVKVNLPGMVVSYAYDVLSFGKQPALLKTFKTQVLHVPGEVHLPCGRMISAVYSEERPQGEQTEFLAYPAELITDIIEVRNRQAGDVFFVEGVGRKKLKKYLIDRKVAVTKRDEMVVVASGNNVLWLLDERKAGYLLQSKCEKWLILKIIGEES